MRSLLLIVVASACSFDPPPSGPRDAAVVIDSGLDPVDAEFPVDAPDAAPGSARKRRITIDPAQVIGDHARFPVWLVIDGAIGDRALADGRDIHFTLPDGTPVPYQRQRWDPATDHLEAWVRLDLSDTAPTVLDLRYGDAGLAHPQDPPAVFANGYVRVWHLESTVAIPDALGSAGDGTPVGLDAAQGTAARLGRGIRFDGSDDEISFANPLAGNTPHTISLWVQQMATSDNDALVVLGNGACGQSRWLHGRFNVPTVGLGFYCNDWPNPAQNIVDAGWTLLHWVYDGSQSTLYRDGAHAAGPHPHGAGSQIDTRGAAGHLGWAPGAWGQDMGAHAILDEVRIATVARSPGYIATEHLNQLSPATFYSVGAEQPAP